MMTTKVFNLSGVPTRRRRLGRKTCVLSGLVGLAKSGPKWSRRDALAAMLNLVVVNSLESGPFGLSEYDSNYAISTALSVPWGFFMGLLPAKLELTAERVADRETVVRLVEEGVIGMATMSEEGVKILGAVVKRGGLVAMTVLYTRIKRLGALLRARKSATTTLVTQLRILRWWAMGLDGVGRMKGSRQLLPCLHVYRSASHNSLNTTKLDPAKVIKEVLSKALFYYHPLAGKLVRHADGKLRINCTSHQGIPFIEAICNCNLSSLHYLDVGWSHAVCDGTGVSQFLRAVAEIARGKTEPSLKLVRERERLVGTITIQPMKNPMDNASLAVSPFLLSTDFLDEYYKVDRESIARLKMSLTKESGNEESTEKKGLTNFETLAAYIWRSRTRALKLSYDGETMLVIIVGVRPRLLQDSLPGGYYGNAITQAFVTLHMNYFVALID
ncbi:Spermidine coumaroyl-CoA acyltransferase [Glycine soja]